MPEAAEVIARSKMKELQPAYAKGENTLHVRWKSRAHPLRLALTQPHDAAGRERRGAAPAEPGRCSMNPRKRPSSSPKNANSGG